MKRAHALVFENPVGVAGGSWRLLLFSDIVFLNCFVYGIPWESPGDRGMLGTLASSLLLPESVFLNQPSPKMCF